jgi:hypothetical protein
MGNSWTPAVLDAFFRLLLDLSALEEKLSLGLTTVIEPRSNLDFNKRGIAA